MKRFKSIITSKSWVLVTMGSLLLISGCGPMWPPDTGSYVDVIPPYADVMPSFVADGLSVGIRYNLQKVAVEAGETGQEATFWALGDGIPYFIGADYGGFPSAFGEDVLYVVPSDATVVYVMYREERGTDRQLYTAHHASNAALHSSLTMLRGEWQTTRQEYEMQGEELIYLGSSETVKLRFQLDLGSQLDNATETIADANDRFGLVIQHVLQEAEN